MQIVDILDPIYIWAHTPHLQMAIRTGVPLPVTNSNEYSYYINTTWCIYHLVIIASL